MLQENFRLCGVELKMNEKTNKNIKVSNARIILKRTDREQKIAFKALKIEAKKGDKLAIRTLKKRGVKYE